MDISLLWIERHNNMAKLLSEFRRLYKNEGLSAKVVDEFRGIIWDYYKRHKREFPWRNTTEPYKIFLSEMMLQQTQTSRVKKKYRAFLKKWPTFKDLAEAELEDVLKLWQGLGYNRRAIWMKNIAEKVYNEMDSVFPEDPKALQKLKGIGEATAGEITAFAFNKPVVFIETNIRRLFIHFFFHTRDEVKDKEIMPLIEKTLVGDKSREWYYALMDYGVMLKKKFPKKNPNKKSAHYRKQKKFEGSNRQLRGKILRYMLKHKKASVEQVSLSLGHKIGHVRENLENMTNEGFLEKTKEKEIYKVKQKDCNEEHRAFCKN